MTSERRSSKILNFLDPDIALSLAVAPVLVALVGAQAIAKTVQELGEMSEEIFRGDRLPILDFSESTNQSDETL